MNKCRICGKEIPEDEYLYDPCFSAEMKRDIEQVQKDREEEIEQYDESWRFKNSRGRMVF